jgi:hypothetical protein
LEWNKSNIRGEFGRSNARVDPESTIMGRTFLSALEIVGETGDASDEGDEGGDDDDDDDDDGSSRDVIAVFTLSVALIAPSSSVTSLPLEYCLDNELGRSESLFRMFIIPFAYGVKSFSTLGVLSNRRLLLRRAEVRDNATGSADFTEFDVMGGEDGSGVDELLDPEEVRDGVGVGGEKGGNDTTRGFRDLLVNIASASKSTRIVSREASGMMDRCLCKFGDGGTGIREDTGIGEDIWIRVVPNNWDLGGTSFDGDG